MNKAELVDILANYANLQCGTLEDAKRDARRMSNVSQFDYKVIKVASNHFLLVTHLNAGLYNALLRACK